MPRGVRVSDEQIREWYQRYCLDQDMTMKDAAAAIGREPTWFASRVRKLKRNGRIDEKQSTRKVPTIPQENEESRPVQPTSGELPIPVANRVREAWSEIEDLQEFGDLTVTAVTFSFELKVYGVR